MDPSINPQGEYEFSDPGRGGTITTGLFYGALGTVMVFVFFHSIWVPILLVAGYGIIAARLLLLARAAEDLVRGTESRGGDAESPNSAPAL